MNDSLCEMLDDTASRYDGFLRDRPVIIMGESSSINRMNLGPLNGLVVIGCNRALRPPTSYIPDFLMMSDRQPYTQERDQGRLEEAVRRGVRLLLSVTIFDDRVRCLRLGGGTKDKEVLAQPEPNFAWGGWVVGMSSTPINFTTFRMGLCSFVNVAGQMLQAAVIMGAKVIGCVGIDLSWPQKGTSHRYGSGSQLGAYPPANLQRTIRLFEIAKKELGQRKKRVMNLSPVKDSAFASVFGNYSYQKFVEQYCVG